MVDIRTPNPTSAVNRRQVRGPITWTRQKLDENLSQIGLQRGSEDWRDHEKAKKYICSFYMGGWLPSESSYRRLIEWICDYLNL